MDTNKAIDIVNAIELLAKTFGEKPQEFATSICLFYEHRLETLNEAIRIKNKFANADIVERGEMLGIKIHKVGNGHHTGEIVLSEF